MLKLIRLLPTIGAVMLGLYCQNAVGEVCPEAIAARLRTAGVSTNGIDSACQATAALVDHGVLLDVRGELLRDLTRVMLPFGVMLGDNLALTFSDVIYCRAEGAHGAELLAARTSHPLNVALSISALIPADCHADLSAVAVRVAPATPDGWSVVARVILAWQPWNLTLTARDVVAAGQPPRWDEVRVALLSGIPLQVTSTDNGRMPLIPDGPDVPASSIVYFADDSLSIALAPKEELKTVTCIAGIPPLAALTRFRALHPESNAALAITHTSVNEYARSTLPAHPIPMRNEIILRRTDLYGIEVSANGAEYTVQGELRDPQGDRYAATIVAEGPDLSVTRFTIKSTPSDCTVAADIVRCEASNRLRNRIAILASLGGLTALGDQPWKAWIASRNFPIRWGGSDIDFTGRVIQLSADPEALVIESQFHAVKK